MTSLEIRYFLTVAEHMSFSGAAEALFVSQPSVSRQIQQLEQELGYALFDRSQKRRLTLTPAGVIFRDYFQRALRGLEESKTAAAALAGHETITLRVGIGLGWDFNRQLLALRRRVMEQYPMAELYFESDTFRNLQAQVLDHRLDAALCTETSVQVSENLEVQLVNRMRGRVFVRKELLGDTPLTLAALDGKKLLMLPEEEETPVTQQLVMLQFLSAGCHPRPVILPNRDSIHQAVLRGEGFAVFDEHMSIALDPRLASIPLEGQISLVLVRRRKDPNPLLRLLEEVMGEPVE